MLTNYINKVSELSAKDIWALQKRTKSLFKIYVIIYLIFILSCYGPILLPLV